MVETIIFGGPVPWSKLKKIIRERLESAKEQHETIQETAEDVTKNVEEFFRNQEIRMK